MTQFRMQPVRVAGYPNSEGQLVFAGDNLIAVVVRLPEEYGDEADGWYIEATFGLSLTDPHTPTFRSLDEAFRWIDQEVVRG